jgi:NAD+ kinase
MSVVMLSGKPCPQRLTVAIVGSRSRSTVVAASDEVRRAVESRGHLARMHLVDEPPRHHDAAGATDAAEASDPGFGAGFEQADLVIVLGGDGSILRTAHRMGYAQKPVIGVNLGTLGFLAHFAPAEVGETLDACSAGRFRLVDHLMFECEILRGDRTVTVELGLNETAILAGPPFSMIEVHLFVDGEQATTWRGDGVIVSTPVGSTAHSLSAGGPILREDLEVFLFTPLNPHALTNRPVVDAAGRLYDLVVPHPNAGTACVVDGRVATTLEPGDTVRVRRAQPRFRLVETERHGYYRTLREKLDWGGGLRGLRTRKPAGD